MEITTTRIVDRDTNINKKIRNSQFTIRNTNINEIVIMIIIMLTVVIIVVGIVITAIIILIIILIIT